MNYLWEAVLQAKAQGIGEERLRFAPARSYSPYMEMSRECLNDTTLQEPYVIEINPYYRFHRIFKDLFHPELEDYPGLREGLFQLLVHELVENDLKMGMTKEAYYKKALRRALEEGVFGPGGAEAFALFDSDGQEALLDAVLTLYRAGESLLLFRHVLCTLIGSCIVYNRKDRPYELLVYIGKKKSSSLERRVDFITGLFVGIRYHVDIYYQYHFGIIGEAETMAIGETAIC